MEATENEQNSTDLAQASSPSELTNPPLHLTVMRSQELDNCPFWISLYKSGSCSPQKIFEMSSIEGIFKILDDEGLSENKPLMMAENLPGQAARQFYLVPEAMCRNNPDATCNLIVSTLEALCPEKVGIYLPDTHQSLLASIHLIEELSLGISFLRTKEIFLFTGSLGLNPLLNAALRIKQRLEGRREVLVFH